MKNKIKDWTIVVLVLTLACLVWSRGDGLSIRAQEHHHDLLNERDKEEELLFGQTRESSEKQIDSKFARELAESMNAMHRKMSGAAATGDADRDFAAMMIPHHEGAIEMSRLILLYGKDERLRRLARGIVIEQQAEIETMRGLLGDYERAARTKGRSIK